LEGNQDAAPGRQLQLDAAALRIRGSGRCADVRRKTNSIVIIEEVIDAQLDLRLIEYRVATTAQKYTHHVMQPDAQGLFLRAIGKTEGRTKHKSRKNSDRGLDRRSK
jgi:hypothetical protein